MKESMHLIHLMHLMHLMHLTSYAADAPLLPYSPTPPMILSATPSTSHIERTSGPAFALHLTCLQPTSDARIRHQRCTWSIGAALPPGYRPPRTIRTCKSIIGRARKTSLQSPYSSSDDSADSNQPTDSLMSGTHQANHLNSQPGTWRPTVPRKPTGSDARIPPCIMFR